MVITQKYLIIWSTVKVPWVRRSLRNANSNVPALGLFGYGGYKGDSTLAFIFRKSWFITARFHSIHLRAYFSQVNVTIALNIFHW